MRHFSPKKEQYSLQNSLPIVAYKQHSRVLDPVSGKQHVKNGFAVRVGNKEEVTAHCHVTSSKRRFHRKPLTPVHGE